MPGSIDDGELIRGRGIVDSVCLTLIRHFDISYNSVTETDSLQETLDVLMISMSSVLDVSLKFRIIKVDICDARGVLDPSRVVNSILMFTDREF